MRLRRFRPAEDVYVRLSEQFLRRWVRNPKVYAFTDPQAAVAQVKAEALIKPTGRIYRQEYVVFLRAAGDKIAYLREYFDPTRAAKSMDATILDLEPCSKLWRFRVQITTRCSGRISSPSPEQRN